MQRLVVTNGHACMRCLAVGAPNLDEAREAINRIIRDGNRASEVIARVRAPAKKSAPAKATPNLRETIHEALAMMSSEARRHRVSVRTELGAGLPPVLGDRVQLQRAVLNLVMNGREAMQAVADRPRTLGIPAPGNRARCSARCGPRRRHRP